MKTATIEITQEKSGVWSWHCKSAAGRTIADSADTYTRRADAVRAAKKAQVVIASAVFVQGSN